LLRILSTIFLAPVYVIISLQCSREVVRSTEVFCWHSCSVMSRVVKRVSNFLIICHWISSFYMVESNNTLFVLSVFGEVWKSGIVMCSCHMFPRSEHLITCALANSKCSVSVCCSCNLIYRHSNTKHVVTISFLSLA